VSYASVYEQTHSRQCCNLLIAWLWTQPVIVLPSVARACDDQSTVHLDWQLGGYSSARVRNVWATNRVLLRISIWFSCQFAGFHVAIRAAIDVCYYCADVWSVLAHFCSAYSRARPSTGSHRRSYCKQPPSGNDIYQELTPCGYFFSCDGYRLSRIIPAWVCFYLLPRLVESTDFWHVYDKIHYYCKWTI